MASCRCPIFLSQSLNNFSIDVLAVFDLFFPSLDGRVRDFPALFQQVIRS